MHLGLEETIASAANVQARHDVLLGLHLGLEAEELRQHRAKCFLQDRVGSVFWAVKTYFDAFVSGRDSDGFASFTEPVGAEAVKGDGGAEGIHRARCFPQVGQPLATARVSAMRRCASRLSGVQHQRGSCFNRVQTAVSTRAAHAFQEGSRLQEGLLIMAACASATTISKGSMELEGFQ